MSYYKTPPNPLREALTAIVGKKPPKFVKGHSLKGLTDKQMLELQDWCSVNSNPRWATGLSMIEAAELIVQQAVSNGNINDEKKEKACRAK